MATLSEAGTAATGVRPSRLHPVSPAFAVVSSLRQLVALVVVSVSIGGPRLLVGILVLQLAFQSAGWWRRTYSFDGEVLRVDEGLLARNQELIPARRVQQVTMVRKLRHRLVGVAELRIETAGGGDGGTVLEVLSLETASRLRTEVLAAKARAQGAGAPPSPLGGAEEGAEAATWVPRPLPLVTLGYRRLALAGLTGAELLVVFAFIASLLQLADDLPGNLLQRLRPLEAGLSAGEVALAVVLFLGIWLGSAVAAAILRDAGYALALVGDELHLQRGLLDRKEGVLPLGRIQAVRITASPLRRAFGLVSVRFQSAGRGTDREESRIDVPILPAAELDRLLALVLPGAAPLPPLKAAPTVALRRALVRRLLPVAAVAVPLVVVRGAAGLGVALVVAWFAGAWGVAAYRGLGHAVDDGFLVTRTGALLRRTVVVPTVRAQSGRVVRSPFQRSLGLATLHVDLAGPGRSPRVVDSSEGVVEAVLERVVGDVVGVPVTADASRDALRR
ncbi:MAG TPA: PH domain-containing protein [Acidimicrobiales bacterium]|nr:PH domain-containing protein [Acidimicrobiales bacterium]